MLKLTVSVLAFVLAGSASAAGWRSMRIDASSEASFNESVTALQEKLPRARRLVLERSLKDIWAQGTQAAAAGEGEFTINDYLRQLDGLKYKEVVEFTDPSGDTARRSFDQAYVNLYRRGNAAPQNRGAISRGPTNSSTAYSGSKTLDAGQSYRANGRIGGTHF